MPTGPSASRMNRVHLGIFFVAALVILGVFLSAAPGGFVSSELKFTDALEGSGLAAVPASCPSSPHTSGECDAPDLNGGACALVAIPSSIYSGQSVALGWNSDEAQTESPRTISPGVGSVGVSGVVQVFPTADTTYTFTAAPEDPSDPDVVCTVDVTIVTGQCSPVYYCFDDDLMYRNNQCEDTLVYECASGCVNGACVGSPQLDGELLATPRLVRNGETTELTWNVSDADTCTVEGSNGDSWTGISGTQTSSALQSQTIYTLSCSGEGGTLIDTETVNIIPVFQET